jgi:hypothetical protein
MKTIIISLLILVSISAKAQTVSSLTLQAQDWAWLIGKNVSSVNSDSTAATEFRKIRDQIRTANPASYTVNVTITNIPEWVVMAFYRTVKMAYAGEIAARYAAITTAIEAKTQLAAQIASFNLRQTNTDPARPGDFERARNLGKTIVMDN